MRLHLSAALLASLWFCCASTQARIFVLSGDSTPAFALTDSEPSPSQPGNRTFFSNVLGSGQDVAVLRTSFNLNRAPAEINEFYASQPGKTSVMFNGPINAGNLAGKELLVIAVPSADFTAAEINVIASFFLAGGSIFALGEAEAIDFGVTTNNSINGLLAALDIPMNLTQQTFDTGLHFATIASHPLTSGVAQFQYGATTRVVGGTPLIFTSGGTVPFVAVVPEPTMLFGCAAIAILLASRTRAPDDDPHVEE